MRPMIHHNTKRYSIFALGTVILSLVTALSVTHSANASSVVVYVPEKYAAVTPGERLYFEIEALYPENTHRQDFKVSYSITESGKEIASATFVKAVETQASFVDYVVIPKTAKSGIHVIDVMISSDDGSFKAGTSASFEVVSDFNWIAIYLSILIAAVAIVGLMLFFEIKGLKRSIKE